MKSWYEIKATAQGEAEVCIYDEIGGWGISAQAFISELKALAGKRITLRINSPGGVVTDGVAIFNALRRHDGGVVVDVDGLAASIASYIALAGQPLRMASNAYLMIHNPSGGAVGSSSDLRKAADVIDKMKVTLLTAYTSKTGRTAEEVSAAMDEETWFTAQEAKEYGLIDEITDGVPMAAHFDLSKFKHPPRVDTHARSNMKPRAEDLPDAPAEETPAEETVALLPDPWSGSSDLEIVDGRVVCNENGVVGPLPKDGQTPEEAWNTRIDAGDEDADDPVTPDADPTVTTAKLKAARIANKQLLADADRSRKSAVAALTAKTRLEVENKRLQAELAKANDPRRLNAEAQRMLASAGHPPVFGEVNTTPGGRDGKGMPKAEFDRLSPVAKRNHIRNGGTIA